ncbi:MAG: methyltransferase domain-containing protein, partial [Acidobacteria bacterium]|nr:methyltransferase domain-containing protein [Acidobacteriota bacterium]
SRRVGPQGIVYAQDVQQGMLNAITRRVQREGQANVRTILGTATDPKLPAGSFDAVLIVDAYHEIDDGVRLLTHVARALKPRGRVGVVDFKLEGGGPGPPDDERVDPRDVINDATQAGLQLLSSEMLPFQYFLIFGRPDVPTP